MVAFGVILPLSAYLHSQGCSSSLLVGFNCLYDFLDKYNTCTGATREQVSAQEMA